MSQTAYATAADYADALLTARRAKNVLFLILFICLFGQLALFFTAKYSDLIVTTSGPAVSVEATTLPTTLPALEAGPVTFVPTKAGQLLQYANGLCGYVGLVSNLVLGVVLLLIVAIMLVGRLVGVARVTSAFIWSAVLLVLIFPWQAFLNNAGLTGVEWKIPGVIYTWNELVSFAKFDTELSRDSLLKWARFVGFPLVALIILLIVQARSSRGLKQALGEDAAVIA